MQKALIIARKEFTDAIKNQLFLVLLGFLLILTVTSMLVASLDYQNKVAEYNKSVQALIDLGKSRDVIVAPQFYPLKMLRGVINYVEIIGAIMGIILGYLSIAKEKGKNTLHLLLSRPLSRFDIAAGKIVGNSVIVLAALGFMAMVIYLIVWTIGGVRPLAVEVIKLILVIAASYLYIMFFFCLTSILALKMKSLSNALVISFVIWLCFVLIIPQVGDTMDPDNQIPGGFFKSMGVGKPQSKEIMKKFQVYETVRNSIEEVSITKRYERISFALLGIKDEYNEKAITHILMDRRGDVLWVTTFFFVILTAEFLFFRKGFLVSKE